MDVLRVMPLLTVSDLDAAVDTYVKMTGMEVVMNHGWIATLGPSRQPVDPIESDHSGCHRSGEPINVDRG
jgi:catechol 2,3-dioxygenase-like lactoylglutathione lyase family enzyme